MQGMTYAEAKNVNLILERKKKGEHMHTLCSLGHNHLRSSADKSQESHMKPTRLRFHESHKTT